MFLTTKNMRLQDIKRYIVRLYVLLQPNGTDKYKCQFGKIEIHSNVFVGAGATIMYNVTIGENVIVAPGAVVTKDVPSGTIVGGIPAKVIGSFEASRRKAEEFSSIVEKMGGKIRFQ